MMQRRRHTFGHLLRLAFFSATVALLGFYWVTSYALEEEVSYRHVACAGTSLTHDEYLILSAAGGLRFQADRWTYTFPSQKDASQARACFDTLAETNPSWTGNYEPRYPTFRGHGWHGFEAEYTVVNNQPSHLNWPIPIHRDVALIVPYWAVGILLCLFTAFAMKRALARRRLEKNQTLCQNCGYDLRASPERCPECGTLRRDMHAQIASS